MTAPARRNLKTYPRRSRAAWRPRRAAWRRSGGMARIIVFVTFAGVWAGCSAQKRYQVLSVFFDGVPDPSAPAAAGGATGGEGTAAFKPVVASTHKPFAEEKCSSCHAGGPDAMTAFSQVTSDVCLNCHKDTPQQYPIMHGPVAVSACLWCHAPHESAQPALLKAPAPDLCMQCHERRLLGSNPPEHQSPSSACLNCHTGHGGTAQFFLRPNLGTPAPPTPAPAVAPPVAPPAARATPPAPAIKGPATQPAARASPEQATRKVEKVFLLQAAPAESVPNGPVVFGERRRLETFGLDRPTGYLELNYRRENDSIRPDVGRGDTFKEDRFEETLTLRTKGYVVHPNLVDLTLAGSFGLRQDRIESDGDVDSNDAILYEHDIAGTLLRNGSAPFTLYSRRNTEVVNRAFGPSLDSTISTTGAVLDLRSKRAPTRLEAYHQDQDLRALDGSESFSLSENTFNWQTTSRLTEDQNFTWNYTFNNVEESNAVEGLGGGSDTFNVHDVLATHTWDFGPARRHNLTSSVNYFSQSGDLGQERLRWDERLRLRHTDRFETAYQYSLDYQSTDAREFGDLGATDQLQHTGIAGFTHRLYRSLVSSGNVGVRDLERSDGSGAFAYFGNAALDYRKLVAPGRLAATVGYAFERQENEAQTRPLRVINDPRVFNDPFPITITGGNVDPGSVEVRDAAGLLVYVAGLDYQVVEFPDRVEVVRVVGGRIANGQTVLVSYDLLALPSNTLTNNTVSGSLRYDFDRGPLKGLGLFARVVALDQDIESEDRGFFFPNSSTDTLVGAEYHFWDQVTLGAEREWHDSEIAPYNATRFYARLIRRLRDPYDTTVSANANYTILDYLEEDNRIRLLLLGASVNRRLSRTLTGTVALIYRDEDDRFFGQTRGVEGNGELRWRLRQTQVFVQARQSVLDTEPQDSSFQSILVGIRREF